MSKGFIWGVKCVLAISPHKVNNVAFASLAMTSHLLLFVFQQKPFIVRLSHIVFLKTAVSNKRGGPETSRSSCR